MKTYLNHENISNFIDWLEHKLKRIPDVQLDYRSDNRQEFEALFYDSYPLTVFVALKTEQGMLLPDFNARFIMEKVGDRVKLAIKYHPGLAHSIERILKEMAEDWPETAEDINSFLNETYSVPRDEDLKPWEKIPEHLWDRTAIEMWCSGYSSKDIANKIGLSPRRVTNRISELRQRYPELVPTNDKRKQILKLDTKRDIM